MNLPLTEEIIGRKLARRSRDPTENPFPDGFFQDPPQKAAVLLPFFRENDRWQLLFIRRTEGMNDLHGGQVAFPGGRADHPGESAQETALRESQEEIGLKPDEIRVLGSLNPLHTISNYIVTPVIGVIRWPYALQLAPEEVARVFSIPLEWLADPENYQVRTPTFRGRPLNHEVIYFKAYSGELLWGVSAKIVLNLIAALA